MNEVHASIIATASAHLLQIITMHPSLDNRFSDTMKYHQRQFGAIFTISGRLAFALSFNKRLETWTIQHGAKTRLSPYMQWIQCCMMYMLCTSAMCSNVHRHNIEAKKFARTNHNNFSFLFMATTTKLCKLIICATKRRPSDIAHVTHCYSKQELDRRNASNYRASPGLNRSIRLVRWAFSDTGVATAADMLHFCMPLSFSTSRNCAFILWQLFENKRLCWTRRLARFRACDIISRGWRSRAWDISSWGLWFEYFVARIIMSLVWGGVEYYDAWNNLRDSRPSIGGWDSAWFSGLTGLFPILIVWGSECASPYSIWRTRICSRLEHILSRRRYRSYTQTSCGEKAMWLIRILRRRRRSPCGVLCQYGNWLCISPSGSLATVVLLSIEHEIYLWLCSMGTIDIVPTR